MLVQISSGQGPAECELAVGKLYKALEREFHGVKLIEARKARNEGCFSSILFSGLAKARSDRTINGRTGL